MLKQCKNCQTQFEITDDDLNFYQEISPVFNDKKYLISPPTLCPDCRQQRRLSFRNERVLYWRKCDATGKRIMSAHHDNTNFPVYDNDYWWSDKWNALEYRRDFDFNRPFFEQLLGLMNVVPRQALYVMKPTIENSDYCNASGHLKNCFLLFNSAYSENCLYGKGVNRCFDCVDCFKIYDCESCYECLSLYNCKFCNYLYDSKNCSECHFSRDLISCNNCFCCNNLINQKNCFFNEQVSSAVLWKEKVENYYNDLSLEDILKNCKEYHKNAIVKYIQELNTENCTGNYLANDKDCIECYDSEYLEKCKYCTDLMKGDKPTFESMDINYFGMGFERCYEGVTIGDNDINVCFCNAVWDSNDVYYSDMCPQGSSNLFGCVGLCHSQYCILNKQYTKEEYNELVPKIIEHMKSTGEWGEFFPIALSPFAYNETVANEYFPLTKEQVISRGYVWQDDDIKDYHISDYKIPINISDVSDEILEKILECNICKKGYKIIPRELKFYRKFNIPIPESCPGCRHLVRVTSRNPRKLWDRKCQKCGKEIQTTYSSERKEIVYCEKCYLDSVY